VRLSLDTHIFLWAVTGDRRLPDAAAEAILAVDTEVHVSAVCVWEVAIKAALGRLGTLDPARLVGAIEGSGFLELPVTATHAAATTHLEPRHRDPFDRLLIAQAQVEHLTLVTVDEQVRRYDNVAVLPL
jgi:PIN domain nuclease of toxin-antitoxin system